MTPVLDTIAWLRSRAARPPRLDFGVEHRVRHRQHGFTFGYLHPDGNCPHGQPGTAHAHEQPCSPPGSWPAGGNDVGSRCKPQYKQALAHVSPADILFYGGAVGGGKSEYAIVEAATLCLSHPGVKVAIFRRTRKELQQELMGRLILLTWAGDKNVKAPDGSGRPFAKYNTQEGKLTFWNGSEIWLCYCDRESHVYKYQSFQIIGLFIDEASHFTESMVKYLMTRVRSAKRGVPKIVRLTSNPGGVGHGWLKRWFIKPVPGELVVQLPDGRRVARLPPQHFETWRPWPTGKVRVAPEKMATRQFIPAWFHDNDALAEADPDYLERAVQQLGGDKARQLAEGDWDANEGMIVGGLWEAQHFVQSSDEALLTAFPHLKLRAGLNQAPIPWHVLDDKRWRPPVGAMIFGSTDYGYGAPWSFHLHAVLPGGHVRTFFEDYGPKRRDIKQADIIKRALEHQTFADGKTPLMDGVQWIVYDPIIKGSRMEYGLAKTIVEVYQDAMPRVQFLPGAAGRQARLSRPNRWMDALAPAGDGLPNWSCTTGCPDLIRTVPDVPWDPDDPDVEDDESENHAYEDLGRFFEARPFAPRMAAEDPYKDLDPIERAHAEAMDKRRKGDDDEGVPTIYIPQ